MAHLYAVPFENLSIHNGEPIALDVQSLFDKVVRRRHGGFCYELNRLFASLLHRLGFRVDMLAARVMGSSGVYGPEFDHLTLMVTLDDRWLVDVGSGDSFREPLLLDERKEQPQGSRTFRLDDQGDHLVLVMQDESGAWRPQYRFRMTTHEIAEFADMCRYHQTSPDSHFTQHQLCSLATPNGRVTISDMRMITTNGTVRDEYELPDEQALNHALRKHFGIVMEKE